MGTGNTGDLDVLFVPDRVLQPVAGLHYLHGADLLYLDDFVLICAAEAKARCRTSLSCCRISSSASSLYSDGDVDLCGAVAVQTAVHVAGFVYCCPGCACLPDMVAAQAGSMRRLKLIILKKAFPRRIKPQ